MSDTAAELVNLCTDETPRRPTKRIRPEVPEPKVLSLVDSEDDSPSSALRPRDHAGQAVECRLGTAAPWGAMEHQQVGPRALVERPPFRQPSARFRRLPVAPQPQANPIPSPIVVDDDDDNDDDDSNSNPLFYNKSGSASARDHRSGVGAASSGLISSALPSRAAAVAVPRLISRRLQHPQQQQEQQEQESQQRQIQPNTDGERLRLQLQQQHQQQHGQQRSQGPAFLVPVPRQLRKLTRVPFRGGALGSSPQASSQRPQEQEPGPRQQHQERVAQEGAADDQEDTDMRLAARLQAEEDERLARETARRLEHEEHRRMMGVWTGFHAAAVGLTVEAAAAGPTGPTERPTHESGGAGRAAPADAGRGGDGTGSGEAAAAALAARWSRLDMLETLESASASLAAADATMSRPRTGRRNDRAERYAGMGGGVGVERDQDMGGVASLRMVGPRLGRAAGSGSLAALFGGAGRGDAEAAARAAAAAAEERESAVAAAAAAAAGSRARWSGRALQDMIPAMMAMPFGFHSFLVGRGDGDDGPGAQSAHRRGRHAALSAYREQAMAMREQLVAAQRAGIPPHLLLSDRDFTPEDYELLCRLDERVENRKGAKDEQLAALPTEVVGADGRRRSDGCTATCSICMEEVAPGDVLKRLPCLHEFHGDCVDTWLKTKACCPICQRGLEA